MRHRQLLFGLTLSVTCVALLGCSEAAENQQLSESESGFELNEQGYFEQQGVGLMVFQDTSPESRQSGLILVSHDNRLASNGDPGTHARPVVAGSASAEPDGESGKRRDCGDPEVP